MKQALLDTLEWYAEAIPADRLVDNGERALALLAQLNEGDTDALTGLLNSINAVLDVAQVSTVPLDTMRACAMEWQD